MFAEVVPLRRTPFGLDGFDYAFDDQEPYQVGQLVYILLRGHKTEAVIRSIKPTSAFAARAKKIVGAVPVSFLIPLPCLELLSWVAERTFSSVPTVLHSWLDTLPKRFPTETISATPSPHTTPVIVGSAEAFWRIDHETALLARATEALREGKRVLLLTPWTNRIDPFLKHLHTATGANVLPLHGDLTHGAYFDHWSRFLEGRTSCLVATRLGAWLAPAADVVLIDEPENDDHKQDEQSPRYDARRMASWAAKYAGARVEAYGLTPPIHATTPAPNIECSLRIHPFHPAGRSAIPSLQADTLLALREHEGPRIIIHPIRGRAARLVCRDCGWQAACTRCKAPVSAEQDRALCRSCGHTQELPPTCEACGGVDLGKAIPGIEQLKRAWSRTEPDLLIEWRDTTNELLEQPIPTGALVVVTLSHLFGGMIEDVRRIERRTIAARRLLNRVRAAQGELIIQATEQDLVLWESWKSTEGVRQTLETELATRRLFHYPPTWRRVKCLIDGSETEVTAWIQQARARILTQGTVEGPFPVEFRRPGASPRAVVHLLFSPDIPEATLIELLKPLARTSLIDLDPIAFFK